MIRTLYAQLGPCQYQDQLHSLLACIQTVGMPPEKTRQHRTINNVWRIGATFLENSFHHDVKADLPCRFFPQSATPSSVQMSLADLPNELIPIIVGYLKVPGDLRPVSHSEGERFHPGKDGHPILLACRCGHVGGQVPPGTRSRPVLQEHLSRNTLNTPTPSGKEWLPPGYKAPARSACG
ncbi:hypothetical protein BDW68DRAFT_22166 [Aspergillus falconensis]